MKKILIASALALSFATPAFAGSHDEDNMKEHFAMHDINKDGSLSPAEWDAASKQMWKEIDANSDGKVTLEEKKAYKEKKHD